MNKWFIEDVNNEEMEINQSIERLKNFKPTIEKPYPTAYESNSSYSNPNEIEYYYDVLAVLAGSKPCCLIDYLPKKNKYSNIIIQKIKNKNLNIEKSCLNFSCFIVGNAENVNNISKSYDILRKYPPGTKNEEVMKAHINIGKNLGFTPEIINDFINRI